MVQFEPERKPFLPQGVLITLIVAVLMLCMCGMGIAGLIALAQTVPPPAAPIVNYSSYPYPTPSTSPR